MAQRLQASLALNIGLIALTTYTKSLETILNRGPSWLMHRPSIWRHPNPSPCHCRNLGTRPLATVAASSHGSARLIRGEALAAVLGADARVAQAVLVAVQVRLRPPRELADRLAVRTVNKSGTGTGWIKSKLYV